MKAIHILVFCLGSIIFSACGDHKTNTDAKDISAPIPQTGIDMPAASLAAPKDLVCGMEMKDGSIGDTAVYQSKVYGFCSPECKGEFKKNPSQYLTQK
jgi:YHS domain-containing protein